MNLSDAMESVSIFLSNCVLNNLPGSIAILSKEDADNLYAQFFVCANSESVHGADGANGEIDFEIVGPEYARKMSASELERFNQLFSLGWKDASGNAKQISKPITMPSDADKVVGDAIRALIFVYEVDIIAEWTVELMEESNNS